MSALTTRLSLFKPGGGSTGTITPDETADIDKLNGNFDLIDAAVGATICTSGTRPSTPYNGQIIFETDTLRFRTWRASNTTWTAGATTRGQLTNYLVADLTALDNISDATLGDTAWMTTPGTGINPMFWVAWAGTGTGIDWRPMVSRIISDTKAHFDTFVAAVAAIADTRFEVGCVVFITGNRVEYVITTDVGAYVLYNSGRVRIIPTIPVITGVSVSAITGLVTAAASASVSFDFGTADFLDYEVFGRYTTSGAVACTCRFRVGGADVATSSYSVLTISASNAAISAATVLAAAPTQTIVLAGVNANIHTTDMYLSRPFVNGVPTIGKVEDFSTQNPLVAATTNETIKRVLFEPTTQVTGVSILLPSGTISGEWWVEGIAA